MTDIFYQATETAIDFHNDDSEVRLLFGPVGCGKSVAACTEIFARAARQEPGHDGIRRNRWAIVRNTYPELKATTIKTWSAWFPENKFGKIKYDSPIKQHIQIADIDLEIFFLPLNGPEDIQKLKSFELTGVYINELQFIDESIFLTCRERINRYPAKKEGVKPSWTGIIADANPPSTLHWMYETFEKSCPSSYKIFRFKPAVLKVDSVIEGQSHAISKDGSIFIMNKDADYIEVQNDPEYWLKLVRGNKDEKIKVDLIGEYGVVVSGKAVHETYNDHLHYANKPLEYNSGIELGLGWDFGLCYSDDTEVLTDNGWKLFKDVNSNVDLAATRNPLTGEMEYSKINFKVEYDYNGELLEWANTEINFCVTPEHIIPFTFRDTPNKVHFKSAEWLAQNSSGHHYVDLCSNWNPNFNEGITYYGMTPSFFSKFMGLYLSEGSCDNNRITIYQNNQNPIMQEILNNTGRKWIFNGNGWRCRDAILAKYLKTFGNAKQKHVPLEIKNMPSKYIQDFINTYTLGDGHIRLRKNGSTEHTIFTTSKKMADDFQELAQKSGWNSSLRKVKPQKSTIIEDNDKRIIMNTGGFSITFKKSAKRAELLKRNFRKINYTGKIYCLNVPYHVLYIRRNGKPSWNGNTPACAIGQLTPRGKFVVLDELWAVHMGLRDFASNIVIPHLDRYYEGWRNNYKSVHDPAGSTGSQTDGKNCEEILKELDIKSYPAADNNDPTRRRDALKFFLGKMVDGTPAFALSNKCQMIREGLMGHFQYGRIQAGGEARFHEKPVKNMYSHICEALEYIAIYYSSQNKKPLPTSKKVNRIKKGSFMAI